MPNQRKKDKKLVGFFADPLEYEAIQKLAKQHAVSVAELLRRIANGTIKLGVWVLGLGAAAALGLALAGTGGGGKMAAQAGGAAPGGSAGHGTVPACHGGGSGAAGTFFQAGGRVKLGVVA